MMLKAPPGERHLARAYYELSLRGAACRGAKHPWPYRPQDDEELFCLAAEMSRYDPRLFSIMVRMLSERWRSLNPAAIRSHYPKMSSPQTVAVIAEFLLRHGGMGEEGRWYLEYLQRGLEPVPFQFFFHHLYRPGGERWRRAMEGPLVEFKRWGFLAREAPVLNEKDRVPIGTRDAGTRRNILRRLIEEEGEVRLSRYLEALGGGVSRQQALLDLQRMEGLRCMGHGRGARWRRAA